MPCLVIFAPHPQDCSCSALRYFRKKIFSTRFQPLASSSPQLRVLRVLNSKHNNVHLHPRREVELLTVQRSDASFDGDEQCFARIRKHVLVSYCFVIEVHPACDRLIIGDDVDGDTAEIVGAVVLTLLLAGRVVIDRGAARV